MCPSLVSALKPLFPLSQHRPLSTQLFVTAGDRKRQITEHVRCARTRQLLAPQQQQQPQSLSTAPLRMLRRLSLGLVDGTSEVALTVIVMPSVRERGFQPPRLGSLPIIHSSISRR